MSRLLFLFIPAALAGVFLMPNLKKTLVIIPESGAPPGTHLLASTLLYSPEAEAPTSSLGATVIKTGVPKQKPLADPPQSVYAIYLTAGTAGIQNRLNALIDLVAGDEKLNAMVIDIKDYSGYLAYSAEVAEAQASGAEKEIKIPDINEVLKRLHEKNIYVIGRISVFQDPVLAAYRPEWAVQSSAGGIWKDRKGLSWLDPGAKPVWDYNLAIAKDALDRGFDEINFDYIRFPSDGDLKIVKYPFSDARPRREVIREFFKYLRENLGDAKISADVFGLTTVASDDLGIGQVIEDAYEYFDYVAPMVYPSHYASGFIGYKNPAAYPYEVVKHSLESALQKRRALINSTSTLPKIGKLRPWLQVFDLGAIYNRSMVVAQMRAVAEVLDSDAEAGVGAGWMLWDPSNNYRGYIQ
jgi:hypothetical protein